MTQTIEPNDTATWPGLEVAIAGTNLSPADIPVRHLIELLEAAVSALDAIAQERGAKMEPPRLLEVRGGSAAYELRLPEPSSGPIVEELLGHVESRSVHSSPAIRRAIARLHRAGKQGSVRLRLVNSSGEPSKPLFVAPPVQMAYAPFETTSEVYARVVAVSASKGDKVSVRLRLDDGGTVEFDANRDVASIAGRLFLKSVRAEVAYEVTADGEQGSELINIEPFEVVPDDEFLGAFDRISAALVSSGHTMRASDWLKELDE